MCKHECARTHVRHKPKLAALLLLLCSLFHFFHLGSPHSFSVGAWVYVSVCVCWRIERVCMTERQAQSGEAKMPFKLRQGLNRAMEIETFVCVCVLIGSGCWVYVCAHLSVRFPHIFQRELRLFFSTWS